VSLLESIRVEHHPWDERIFTVYHYSWTEGSELQLKRAVFRVGRPPCLTLVSAGVKQGNGHWVYTGSRGTLDEDMIRVATKQAQQVTGVAGWRVAK